MNTTSSNATVNAHCSLLSVLNDKGEQVHKDMKDIKIIEMAKKIRNLTYELNKHKGMGKKAEEAILMLDQELEKKQHEIDSLATPEARAAIMKTMVGGVDALEPTGSTNTAVSKKLSHDLQVRAEEARFWITGLTPSIQPNM